MTPLLIALLVAAIPLSFLTGAVVMVWGIKQFVYVEKPETDPLQEKENRV